MLLIILLFKVVVSQTIFMFVVQCEIILTFIIHGIRFTIDILIRISLLASILDTLTIICDEFDVKLFKISDFGRSSISSISVSSGNNNQSMIEEGVGMGVFLDIVQVLNGVSLNMIIFTEFDLFVDGIDPPTSHLDGN